MPQNETVEEPLPARFEAPKELYEQDSEFFPEDLYEEELIAKEVEEGRQKALRIEVCLEYINIH